MSAKIENVYTFSNLKRINLDSGDFAPDTDLLVINRPWKADAASRSRLQEKQFTISLSDFIRGLSRKGELTEVVVSSEIAENVLEVRQVNSSGKIEYFLSNKIGGVQLDEYLSNTFLTIDETLTEEITANGVGTVGGVEDGYTFSAGTSFVNILKKLLQKANPASYLQSTVVLGISHSTTVEVGQFFVSTLTITYTKRDSGVAIQGEFFIAGVSSNTQNTTLTSYVYATPSRKLTSEGASVIFQGEVDHSQGAQKFDNFGNPSGDPATLVPARLNLSTNTITVVARRKLFYGVNNAAPTTSAQVRAWTGNQYATTNTFSINVIAGNTSVEFAIPSHKTLVLANFVGALVSNQTSLFAASLINLDVEGADPGQDPDSYKIYRYVPSVPFGSTAVYNITIA